MMDHNFETQRDDTLWVWNNLSSKKNVPKLAILELQFVPDTDTADWKEFELRLVEAGYGNSRYEDGSTLEASIGPIDLSFDTIWKHELTTTRIAIKCGFHPDGWGFSAE